MAKEKETKETTEELAAADKIALFIAKYRVIILAVLAFTAAGVIGAAAFFTVRNELQKRAIVKLTALEKRLGDIGDPADETKTTEVQALAEEFNSLAGASFGYAAAKAYSLAAGIYAERKEWAKAEEAWKSSAEKGEAIYIAPISLYNAAAAAEEQGKLDAALDYFGRCLAFTGNNPAAPRARFNMGRIYETEGRTAEALEAYRALVENESPDSSWVKLAHSRIISLGG
ncbi:MAG: tetratricopeptide repeat protein [Treponema sp.]|jgi:tetratricopeptide (TPR) repeat protein|nr:tetratricopeptide repeat protein [Treponema sp.]